MMSLSGPSSTPPKREGRRYLRCHLDTRVLVHVFRSGSTNSIWGRTSELGEDGLSATLTGTLEPTEVVSLEFQLPMSTEPMKLRAVVRYRDGFRHGFEFLTLSEQQRTVLQRALNILPTS
jgi:hypothetical protein